MPHEPKRRHSRTRKGERRASIKLRSISFVKCSNCGAMIAQHAMCAQCGYYRGKEIVTVKQAKSKA
jgi:large subunit ribosomal protein L32